MMIMVCCTSVAASDVAAYTAQRFIELDNSSHTSLEDLRFASTS